MHIHHLQLSIFAILLSLSLSTRAQLPHPQQNHLLEIRNAADAQQEAEPPSFIPTEALHSPAAFPSISDEVIADISITTSMPEPTLTRGCADNSADLCPDSRSFTVDASTDVDVDMAVRTTSTKGNGTATVTSESIQGTRTGTKTSSIVRVACTGLDMVTDMKCAEVNGASGSDVRRMMGMAVIWGIGVVFGMWF